MLFMVKSSCEAVQNIPQLNYYWSQTSADMVFFRPLYALLASFAWLKKGDHVMTNISRLQFVAQLLQIS